MTFDPDIACTYDTKIYGKSLFPSTENGVLAALAQPNTACTYHIYSIRSRGGGGGLLFIKINLQTRLLIVTRIVNEADIVNKTRPLFTLSLEMTRLVNKTRLLIQIYTVTCFFTLNKS